MDQLNTKIDPKATGEPIPVISKDLLAMVQAEINKNEGRVDQAKDAAKAILSIMLINAKRGTIRIDPPEEEESFYKMLAALSDLVHSI